jgi:hypothetical protein
MSVQKQPDHGKELVKKIRDQLLESDHLGESGNMGRVKHRNTSSLALRLELLFCDEYLYDFNCTATSF